MQFKALFTLATLAMAAAASPVEVDTVKRTEPGDNISCGNKQTVHCCDSVEKGTGLIPIGLGLNCLNLGVIQIPVANAQCKGQVACCNTKNQVGLINIGNLICGPVL